MFKKVSLGFPRTQSLNSVFSEKKKKNYFSKSKNGVLAPVALDRYLTNEGHRYVASILRRTQIQKDIQSGSLHKITEKDVDELLKSYYDNGGGVKVNVYETLNYENLNLSLHECKLLAKLLKSDDILTIKTLKLSKNNLHKSSLNSILNALHKNTTLKTLDLSFNSLTDADAKKVSKLLKKNNTIKELYLSFNRIGTEGAKSLSKALKQNSSIERFSLESNQLNSQGGQHIAEMLKLNKTIKYIHLGSNNLQITGMESIAEALKVNNTLVSLSLDINNITSEGTEFLSKALEVNKNLTHLYMSRNNIGDNGLKHLSKALLSNTTITYLDLEFNSIGDQIEGVESLGETLEKHVVPRAINLTNNRIGDEGCAALFSGFHKNKTLESIILSQCNIGLDGIKVISEALKNNEGLQNLSLHKNNDMGADGHLELAQALEQNTSLKSIQLDYNFAEWEMVGSSIHQSLTRNHLLQREKYNIACRILKVARIMLNASVKQQLPTFNKRNNINDDNKRNSIQQRFQLYQPTQNSPPTTVIPYASPPLGSNGDGDDNFNNNKLEFTKLPFEIQEQILFALDTNQVLTHMQKVSIIKWSLTKSTLGKSMEEFLTENLSAYYPLTSDVRLWPTEANNNYAEERF